MKKFIKKITDIVWALLGAIAVFFTATAAILGKAFLLWPRKKPGEKVKSNIGWFFYPHLFEKTFSNKIYIAIIVISILIIGLVLFLTYF